MNIKNQKVVEKLNKLLSDYQVYYQNLRGLHWNIKGAMFFMLHEKFEEYYNEASEVIDEIAERILMVGGRPLHTFGQYIETSTLKEVAGVSEGKKGIELTLDNNRSLLNSFKELFELAGETSDEGTASLMSEWIGLTEKRIWILESFLH